MALSPVGDMGIALKSDVDDFHKGMRTSKESVGLLANSIRGLSAAVRNMGIVITGVSAIAGGAMFALSRKAERVNEAYREVDTISSEVADSQKEYGDLISEINTELGVQASKLDLIQGLYKSVSAGVQEGEESQRDFLMTASELAVVGRVDLATTVDILSTSINAYNKSTEFATRASNALFRTVQFGKTTMEELAPVMGRVTALGSDMKVQIEELGAVMAVLTRTGFETRIAATGLRAMLRSMIKPSETMQAALQDLALENDLFADSMENNSEAVRELSDDYREASDALQELEEQQKDARTAVEENSLVIQEARLVQQAIEQDSRKEIQKTISNQFLLGKSYEELGQIIEDYRFKVNKARVEEEQAVLQSEKFEEEISNLENEFKSLVEGAGGLGEGIGQLVVQNQGFIETLTQLREEARKEGIGMGELFQRSRALQAALAVLGDEGELVNEIYAAMKEGGELTADEMERLSERFGTTEERIKELRDGVTDVSEEFDDTTGATHRQRKSFARLSEAATELGRVFNTALNDQIEEFSIFIEELSDKLAAADEAVKDNVGRFAVLATAIGLVVGPLLIFFGQLALIATAMGTMFLPFVLVAGTAVGVLAEAFMTARDNGEETESMLDTLGGIFSGLVNTITFFKNVFVEEVLPGMRDAGQGLIDVFVAVKNEFVGSGEEGRSTMRSFASVVGDAFSKVGSVLSNNSGAIADAFRAGVDFIVNRAIPAVFRFAKILFGLVTEDIIPVATDLKNIFLNDVAPRLVGAFTNKIIPAAQRLADILVGDVFPNIINTLKNDIIPAVLTFSRILSNKVIPAIVGIFNNVLIPVFQSAKDSFQNDVSPGIVNTVKNDIIPAFEDLWESFNNDALPWLRDFFDEDFIPSVQSLLEGLTELVKSFKELSEEIPVDRILHFLDNGAIELLNTFTGLVDSVGNFLSENAKLISQFVTIAVTTWATIKAVSAFGAMFAPIAGAISSIISSAWAWIQALVVVKAMMPGVSATLLGARAAAHGLSKAILGVLGPVGWLIAIVSILASAWATDFLGMRSTLQPLVDGVVNLANKFNNRVTPQLKNFLGSVVTLGKALVGLIVHVSDVVGAFLGAKGASATLKFLFTGIMLVVGGLIDMFAGLIQILSGALDAVSALAFLLQGDFDKAWKSAKDSVENFVFGSWKIIRGFLKLLAGILVGIPGTIFGFILDTVFAVIELFVWLGNILVSNKGLIADIIKGIVFWFAQLAGKVALAVGRNAWKILDELISIRMDISDWFENELLPNIYTWATNIPKRIADGIKSGIDKIGDAMDEVMDELGGWVPRSPAEKGFFSENPPKEIGEENIVGNISEGIRSGEGDIENSMESLFSGVETPDDFSFPLRERREPETVEDFERMRRESQENEEGRSEFSEMESMLENGNVPDEGSLLDELDSGRGRRYLNQIDDATPEQECSEKIVVDKKAIFFERGAFQGVSDDELPEKVRDTVDESLEDIIRRLRTSGKNIRSR